MNTKLAGWLSVLALACGALALASVRPTQGANAQPGVPGPPVQYQLHQEQNNLFLFDPTTGRVWVANGGEWNEAVKPLPKK
jgi:hypothetical protein